jgi:hypothetical protein
MDDLASRIIPAHHTPELILWLFEHGIMPLYTPVGGSWLNMAESIQGILVRRALEGQNPQSPAEIIAWLEAVARGWNEDPTPFEWGGKRAARRERSRNRRPALGGSGACSRRPIRAKTNLVKKWQSSCQLTHQFNHAPAECVGVPCIILFLENVPNLIPQQKTINFKP